jgi:hypothetical protein
LLAVCQNQNRTKSIGIARGYRQGWTRNGEVPIILLMIIFILLNQQLLIQESGIILLFTAANAHMLSWEHA